MAPPERVVTVSSMNESEQEFISSEVMSNFGKNLGRPTVDPARLRDALASAVARHLERAEVAELRDGGAHYFVVPADDDGFELRLGHHDLPALNEPGAVAGTYVTLGVLSPDDIAL